MISIDRNGFFTPNQRVECSIMEYMINARCVPIMQNEPNDEPKLTPKL